MAAMRMVVELCAADPVDGGVLVQCRSVERIMDPAMTRLLGWSSFPLCTNVSPEAPHQPSLLYLRINPHLPSSCLSCPSCNPGTDVPPLRGTSSGPLRRQSSNQSLCNETQRRCHLRSLSPSPSNWHCWQDELHVRDWQLPNRQRFAPRNTPGTAAQPVPTPAPCHRQTRS